MSAGPQRRLKRVLGFPSLVLFGITFVGPTAPFPMFGIASHMSRGHLATAYLLAMVAMVLTASSYGSMAAAIPAAGSAYSYVRRTMHPAAGFMVGWTMILDYVLIPLLSVIYMALTAHRLLPGVPYGFWAVLFSAGITLLNLFGLRVTNRANCVMTAIMAASVVWFVIAACRLLAGHGGAHALLSLQPFYNPGAFSLAALMPATAVAAFSYMGFDGISTLAEDALDPRRDIGRATVAVCLVSGLLFIVQAYLGQRVWPDFNGFPNVETGFLDVARRAGGAALYSMVSSVLMVAGVASAVTGQASASRLLFGMGRDRLLPRLFTYVHPKYSTPTYGVLATGAITLAAAFLFSFQLAAEAVNFGAFVGFMGVNLSVIRQYSGGRCWRDLVRYRLCPGAGFAVCAIIFLSLSPVAKTIGVVWCVAGAVYAASITSGFRRPAQFLAREDVFAGLELE